MNTFFLQFISLVLFLSISHPGAGAETREISYSVSGWKPMAYINETNEPKGLLVGIAREVMEKEMGLNLVVKVRPWKRAQKEVETGESDFLITVATKARKNYALVSENVFYSLPLYIYTYKNHEKRKEIDAIKSVRDIKKLNLMPVTNLGNGWHKENVDVYGIDTHYAGKEENILFLLANKRADIVIDAVVPTNYLIEKFKLNQKVELTASRFSRVDFHLLLGKKSRFAGQMPLFDSAFTRSKDRIHDLIAGYEAGASVNKD